MGFELATKVMLERIWNQLTLLKSIKKCLRNKQVELAVPNLKEFRLGRKPWKGEMGGGGKGTRNDFRRNWI